MQIDLSKGGLFSRALVHLAPGEKFVSDAGAMIRASSNIDIDVTTDRFKDLTKNAWIEIKSWAGVKAESIRVQA
jgi:uncharacterized protein (AIM24 family)